MSTEQDIPFDRIAKSLSGECSEYEKNELEKWKKDHQKNMEEFNKIKQNWDNSTPKHYEPDVEKALRNISDKLPGQKKPARSVSYFATRIAAVFILALGVTFVLRNTGTSKMELASTLPGSKPVDIKLADGSTISLNAGSSVKYPKKFDKKERKILFEGEAYFKIAKDKKRPFIIKTKNSVTKVLGTEFNLTTTSADSIIRITVTEGLVSFKKENESKDNKEVFVKAGEVGELDTEKGIITSRVNNDLNYLAWKNGVLTFKDKPFGEALKSISEFYNTDIHIETGELSSVLFNGTFDSLSFREVLSSIELIMDVDIETEGEAYIIREKL